jgi:hypothetical protein
MVSYIIKRVTKNMRRQHILSVPIYRSPAAPADLLRQTKKNPHIL